MKVIIISIGDELLNGQVVNTNASWMSGKLHEAGIEVIRIIQVRDDENDIRRFLDLSMEEAGAVIMTGGLGPTRDDITKQVLCEHFGDELVLHQPTLDHIHDLFGARRAGLLDSNVNQALVPSKCTLLPNAIGTAPGLWMEREGKIAVALPGVPFEMERIAEESVIPRLKQKVESAIISRTVLTQGVGESMLAHKISDWEDSLPENIKLAYLPQPGIVRLRLTGRGSDPASISKEIDKKFSELEEIIPELIFGYGNDRLEKIVGDLLKKYEKTVSVAESCTGGYLSHLLTSVPGSSAYFPGGVVSYSDPMKLKVLGVKDQTIKMHGAVSELTVREMAHGVSELTGSDYAIAISGIAGPDGGTTEKPVGTVWVALKGSGGILAERFTFGNHRYRNIRRSALAALNLLRKELMSLK